MFTIQLHEKNSSEVKRYHSYWRQRQKKISFRINKNDNDDLYYKLIPPFESFQLKGYFFLPKQQ